MILQTSAERVSRLHLSLIEIKLPNEAGKSVAFLPFLHKSVLSAQTLHEISFNMTVTIYRPIYTMIAYLYGVQFLSVANSVRWKVQLLLFPRRVLFGGVRGFSLVVVSNDSGKQSFSNFNRPLSFRG